MLLSEIHTIWTLSLLFIALSFFDYPNRMFMRLRYVNNSVKLILQYITPYVKLFSKIFPYFCLLFVFLVELPRLPRSGEGILYYVYFFAQGKMPQKKREGESSYHTRI